MVAFVSVTSLVSASMARQREIDRVARYGAAVRHPVTATPAPVTSWPDGKLIAILRILRSDFAKDCLAHWDGHAMLCGQHDFASLRDEGLAFKRELGRYHELTQLGRAYAESAVRLVAQRLGLHHVRNTAPDTRYNDAHCTCGWRKTFDERYGRTDTQIRDAINRHLAEVKAT